MKNLFRYAVSVLVVFFLMVTVSYSGTTVTVNCDSYKMDLSGATNVYGALYREHVVLNKVHKSGNAQGKWKLTAFEQQITYSSPITIQINRMDTHDLGHGMWMKVQSSVLGNTVRTNVIESNVILDVVGNRIGYVKTNTWCGTINGREVSFKWHQASPTEPVLRGRMVLKGERLKVSIVSPKENEQFVFSEDSPGVLSFVAKATVSPQKYAANLIWEVEDIEGSSLSIDPVQARGPKITIKYTKLPAKNAQFGYKKLTARLQVEDCNAVVSSSVRVFFPAMAKNNPGATLPNWFYYWKQTSAKVGPAKFGGNTGFCEGSSRENLLGYYRNEVFDSVYYICDLQKLGEGFPFKAKQDEGGYLTDRIVKGIDTFAIASHHENAHYTHSQIWWKQHYTSNKFQDTNRNGIRDTIEQQLDKDKDLVPDSVEPQYGLNPNNKNTYGIGPDGDDEEYLAWQAEAAWKAGSADKEDWAKPGKQWPGN